MLTAMNSWVGRAFSLDARSLAVFRLALGLIICTDALLRTRDFTLMFAADGMFPLSVLRGYLSDPCAWSLAFCVDATWWSAVVLALEGVAGVVLAVGWGGRWATVAAWVAVVSVVRRTAPATNAGDLWLICLLFWGMFLPLTAAWSLDACWRRDHASRDSNGPVCQIFSAATVAIVLQIAAVYVSAGLAKCNESWFSGDAFSYALSVHDHGTHWGSVVGSFAPLAKLITWSVLAIELVGPCLLIAWPLPSVRLSLVALFLSFHLAICVLMSVGIFGPVGMAAWLAVVPTEFWNWLADRRHSSQGPETLPKKDTKKNALARAKPLADWLCAGCGAIAIASFAHHNSPFRHSPLPAPLASAVRLTGLHQDWNMFGQVLRQEQWVYSRAQLASGHIVDVLRQGRGVEPLQPAGGFSSLPHHRWHKIFWELPHPPARIFSASIAAAIAHQWNRTHAPAECVHTLEIRFARLSNDSSLDTLHELLLATWPPRDPHGSGNLDRLLEEQGE